MGELPTQQTIDAVRVDDGCTALHLAAYSGSTECVKLLLEAGADVTLVNCYGETPFQCAAKKLHADSLLATFSQFTGKPVGISNDNSQEIIGRPVAKILQRRSHTTRSRTSCLRGGTVAQLVQREILS